MFDFIKLALNNNLIIIENKKWVDLSVKFGKFEEFQMVAIQGLGKFSIYLDKVDSEILLDSLDRKNRNPESYLKSSQKLSDAFMLSYLWVLGAYESIRTISQRLDHLEKNNGMKYDATHEVRRVKHLFEEIRIPLAKMEISKKHKKNAGYSPIAYPILDTRRGIAWNFGVGKNVSRKELAEEFLGLLDFDFDAKK